MNNDKILNTKNSNDHKNSKKKKINRDRKNRITKTDIKYELSNVKYQTIIEHFLSLKL